MAKLYGDRGGAEGRDVTVDEFLASCFGQGDPFAPLEDGDTVEYTNEENGNIGIFIYNTVYEFSPEEFEELRAKAPKIEFRLEEPEHENLPAPDWDTREFEALIIKKRLAEAAKR